MNIYLQSDKSTAYESTSTRRGGLCNMVTKYLGDF